MPQHDYSIADASGGAFLADLNNALSAIASSNSGATAPLTTYAYQLWADTTAGLLKQRNAANNAWITIGSLGTANLGLASLPTTGRRNLVINGNPIVNQRGYTAGSATSAAYQYTVDRWRVRVSGQSVSWSDSLGIRTITAPAGGVEQIIEGSSVIGTQTYTLSWIGTATADLNGSAVANGGNVTLTGGAAYHVLGFSNGTLSRVQLERGSVATPFEFASYGQELSLCQRYYQSGNGYGVGYGPTSGNYRAGQVHFPVTMRASPSVLILTYGLTASANVGGQSPEAVTDTRFGYYVYLTSAGSFNISFTWVADAEF
jgi:hypothetical protein